MSAASTVALLAILPGAAGPRARAFAREVAGRSVSGMGAIPSWQLSQAELHRRIANAGPYAGQDATPIRFPWHRGMGFSLPPLNLGQAPAWSPDAVKSVGVTANDLYGVARQIQAQEQGRTPAQAPAKPWWPPSQTMLAVGGGALTLLLVALVVMRRRGKGSAPAPAAPIVVISSPAPAASPVVKANRGRFSKGGRRWSAK